MRAHVENYEQQTANEIRKLSEQDTIKMRNLEDELAAEKRAYRDRVQRRIQKLEEAQAIAERLGIEHPTTPYELGPQSSDQNIVYTDINAQGGIPLYFMGTEALKTEAEVLKASLDEAVKTNAIRNLEKRISQLQQNRRIEALKRREDKKAFIPEYNQLREENTVLRAISIDEQQVEPVELANAAYQPSGPDSPRKVLVLVLSVLLGGMIGVFMAFFARFARSMRYYSKAA